MIQDRIRFFSEKNTSVETDIPLLQTGVISQYYASSNKVLVVPTTIKNPTMVEFVPLDVNSASVGNVWVSGGLSNQYLQKFSITNSSVSSALTLTSTTAINKLSSEHLAKKGRDVYIKVFNASTTAASLASLSFLASNTYYTKLEKLCSTQESNFLLLKSGHSKNIAHCKFAFTVVGY